jgi:hypothetical protein
MDRKPSLRRYVPTQLYCPARAICLLAKMKSEMFEMDSGLTPYIFFSDMRYVLKYYHTLSPSAIMSWPWLSAQMKESSPVEARHFVPSVLTLEKRCALSIGPDGAHFFNDYRIRG